MERLCVICLATCSNTAAYVCNHYYSSESCCNSICAWCSLDAKMDMYNHIHPIYKHNWYNISFCCNACAITYYTRSDIQWILDKNNPLLIKQHNIHISILSRKYLNNYIINDLTNIVIEYLVE